MPSILNATTTNGIAVSGDNSGVLELQTNSGATIALSLGTTGNINIPTLGARITGDFSNATVANRVLFQTSTTNANTTVGVIPNGTAQATAVALYASSSTLNAGLVLRTGDDTGDARVSAGVNGAGTSPLPLTMFTGGSERLRIDTSGNVGIGISSPAYRLDVSGGHSAVRSAFAQFWFNSNNTNNVSIYNAGASGGGLGQMVFETNGSERMRITSGGNVGIGTSSPNVRFEVVGTGNANSIMTNQVARFGAANALNIGDDGTDTLLGVGNSNTNLVFLSRVAGSYSRALTVNSNRTITFDGYGAGTLSTNSSGLISASDGRYKTKTRLIENGLEKIIQLQPTYYKWKEDSPFASKHEELGFIAQEVAAVIPEASPENDDEIKYRNYNDRAILAMLVKAIQELKAELDSVKAELKTLKGA